MSNIPSTIHEMLKSFLSLIASLGSLMFTALNVFGIDFLKYNHKTRILAINENILVIIILLKYSINPITKKTAETILTKLLTMSRNDVESAIKPLAIKKGNNAFLSNPKLRTIAKTIGVSIKAAPS